MNKDEIKELIAIMDEAELTSLRIVEGDKEIALERKPAAGITPTTLPGLAERVEALLSGKAQAHESAAIADDITDDDNTVLVRSPMVGTF
ncbi:MAG: acetyl-CoA carboxylase, biotin carboxyl carrier protein, partial [Eggerthellaceae bacterium]